MNTILCGARPGRAYPDDSTAALLLSYKYNPPGYTQTYRILLPNAIHTINSLDASMRVSLQPPTRIID